MQVWELKDGNIRHLVISPESFGLRSHPLSHVRSGTSQQNAAVARYLFNPSSYTSGNGIPQGPLPSPLRFTSGQPSKTHTIPVGVHLDALHDFILLQASALLYVAGRAQTLPGAVKLARRSLMQGGAGMALDILRAEANRAGDMLEQQQKEREERELRRINKGDVFYYSKDMRNPSSGTDLESDVEAGRQ